MSARTFLASLLAFGLVVPVRAAGIAEHVVVIVWDGFRPDFVTPDLTPNLWQLRTNGVWFARHHAVYPSITEANGSALATGGYPRHTDIIGDSELRLEITNRAVGMENLRAVRAGDALSENHFLAMPTLAELLHGRGERTAIAGSKTVALLLDRAARQEIEPNGPVLYANATLPRNLWGQLTNRFGAPGTNRSPNTARDAWTTRCLIDAFWEKGVPKFSMLWMSDVDLTQHSKAGVGSEVDLEAVRGLDSNLGLVLAELDRRELRSRTDIFLVSDHGFSTVKQTVDASVLLRRSGLNARRQFRRPAVGDDIFVVGNAGSVFFYVINHNPEIVARAVKILQRAPFSGPLFTRLELPGTFLLSQAGIDSPHAPDIVLSLGWQAGQWTNRLPGLIFGDGTTRGTNYGTHATLSPTDMHNTCVAFGPDFRAGLTSAVPSGNVDIAPTIMWLLDLKPPTPVDGRILFEAMTATNAPALRFITRTVRAGRTLPGGAWSQYLTFTEVNGVRYLDEGNGKFTAFLSTPRTPFGTE